MVISNLLAVLSRLRFFLAYLIGKIQFGKHYTLKNVFTSYIDRRHELTLVNGNLVIGRSFKSRTDLSIRVTGGQLNIGSNVFFNQGVSINCRDSIFIGSHCLFGENVKIYDHNHNFSKNEFVSTQGFSTEATKIGRNVWIGTGAILLKGASIGDNSVISAGCVVSSVVPEDHLLKRNGECVKIIRD
ncbi:Acetyltransferase (isoleucine patch superfamily) [Ferrimonas sediminum]|uniref:Acetyltransferase (Isoleucine patch superfamily) n=1 Tax=Ferrimonas sediminum TaxID=718193 RepID=A0A1G8Z1C2_9GAMM|nr:acyltransferase [Ferrimonas sediminum]SDK08444.1 Acetyltransferase (isoleucine patch superfamily) [Ferrimonas sediminum]